MVEAQAVDVVGSPRVDTEGKMGRQGGEGEDKGNGAEAGSEGVSSQAGEGRKA